MFIRMAFEALTVNKLRYCRCLLSLLVVVVKLTASRLVLVAKPRTVARDLLRNAHSRGTSAWRRFSDGCACHSR
ncbi:hypothetical protein C8Q74DRAFT_1252720 [Fomes fomentarius]|nr:hypothetical protein C8Q74DRAFT_1252720 [Fomes fomentarius]